MNPNYMSNPESAFCRYEVDAPYPPVKVSCPNPEYARAMLSNMGSSNSEMSAISLYFYNSLITGPENRQISICFEKISVVEMHHLEIFGELALQLGADPRLWSIHRYKKVYWTPGYNHYPRQLKELLLNSIEAEKAAIRKYTGQSQTIKDPNIVENLKRIIMDESKHVEVFTSLYERYVK